jgi:FdhD protein
MTMKAIRAGVPILASKALPTDKAVELAQEFHLTLIGGAHPDCFQVFHREEPSVQ